MRWFLETCKIRGRPESVKVWGKCIEMGEKLIDQRQFKSKSLGTI
jgi:hypothetical protein